MQKSYFTFALVTLGVISALTQGQVLDPCNRNNYKELNDPLRSTAYTTSKHQTLLCDSQLQQGWYRFTSAVGTQMPTECVANHRCSTIVPLWMRGTHPSVADGIVKRDVCGNYVTAMPGCCDEKIEISVKNCNDQYYVYKLSPPRACAAAYCAGDKIPCPFGKWSRTGLPPCKDAFPQLKTPPTLTGPHIINNNKGFNFVCEINHPDQDPDQAFEVTWTFDGQENPAVTSQIISDPTRVVTLDGSALNGGFFNKDIACVVRAFYKGNEKVKSQALASKPYFAGIKISPPKLEISERDKLKTVSLTSTVPIVCDHEFKCCLYYFLDVDADNQMSVQTDCKYELCSTDYDPKTKTATLEVQVAAKQDMIDDGEKQLLLTFEHLLPAGGGKYLDIFFNHQDQIVVDIKDERTSTCSITGDPHITGFDYRRTYHLYKVGDYIAYQVPSRHFQLQIRTWRCWKVTCVCGVVVQEGNDIIKIDQCNQPFRGRHTSPVVQIGRKLSEGTVVQRSNTGAEIGVYLGSGTEVKIHAASSHLNVFLTTPGTDRGLGKGICGTNDGEPDNDFTYPNGKQDRVCSRNPCLPNSFLTSWQVTGEKSLFERIPDVVPEDQEVVYCKCKENQKKRDDPIIDCSNRENTPTTGTACTKNCKTIHPGVVVPNDIRKRSVEYVDEDTPDNNYNPEEIEEILADMPWTEAPVTESQAEAMCSGAVKKSPLYDECKDNVEMSEMAMADCKSDVLHGGTTELLEDVTNAFTSLCQVTMAKDPVNYVENAEGKRTMMSKYLEEICDLACEKHGRCVQGGGCECDEGWEGPNCQIQSGIGPQLFEFRSGPLCDRAARPCQKIFTDVSNIIVDSDLKCRTQAITEEGQYLDDPHDMAAEFLSMYRISCPVPETVTSFQRYNISAGNEAAEFGNELTLLVFDSTCMDCDTQRCTVKTTACHIDNVCYNDGAKHKDDNYKVCDISKSLTQWTVLPKPDNSASKFHPATLLVVLLTALWL